MGFNIMRRITIYGVICLTYVISQNAYSSTGLFGEHIFANNWSKAALYSNKINAGSISAESGGNLTIGKNSQTSTLSLLYKGGREAAISAKDFGVINILSPEIYISSNADNSTGVFLGKNGDISLTRLNITLSGQNSSGVIVEESGISMSNASIVVSGYGIHSSGNEKSTINGSAIISRDGTGVSATEGSIIEIADSSVTGYTPLHATSGGSIVLSGDSILSSTSGVVMISDGVGSLINTSGHVDLTGDIKSINSGNINLRLDNDSTFIGAVDSVSGDAHINLNGSKWILNGSSTITALTLQNSVLQLSNPKLSKTSQNLNIKGDFNANDSIILLGAELGADNSLVDKLIIHGNTSGSAMVIINNLGGKGCETKNGIELIHVDGKSAATFTQSGRIIAGVYDYYLVRGEGINEKNWYLTSKGSDKPIYPTEPNKPTTPNEPIDSNNSTDSNKSDAPIFAVDKIRPEPAAYAINAYAANTLFMMTLHDRLGEMQYLEKQGENKLTSLWLRNIGGHNRSTDSSGQKTQTNRYIIQVGGDIVSWSTDGDNRFDIGIMGGHAIQHGRTHNNITSYAAASSITGYSTGLYATWTQNNKDKAGVYVDTWALYNWFNNSISGDDIATERYKSKGITASVETGYTWKLVDLSEYNSWYMQPQAQLTYMGVKTGEHHEKNGTFVISEGDGNLQSRLGARTYLNGHNVIDDKRSRTFELFIEANWIHNTDSFGATLDGVRIDMTGASNIGELKTGVVAKLNKTVYLWGSVAQQFGNKGYSDTQGIFGVRVSF